MAPPPPTPTPTPTRTATPTPSWRYATGTLRAVQASIYQDGDYYLEDAGRIVALLYSGTVDLRPHLGHRVTVGGPYHMAVEDPQIPVIRVNSLTRLTSAEAAKRPAGATAGW